MSGEGELDRNRDGVWNVSEYGIYIYDVNDKENIILIEEKELNAIPS